MGIQWVGGSMITAFGVCINRHNGHGVAALFHRKIEEGGGVGLVFQRDMPQIRYFSPYDLSSHSDMNLS